jgi:hypothetical protein
VTSEVFHSDYLPPVSLQPAAVFRHPLNFSVGNYFTEIDIQPPYILQMRASFSGASDPQAAWGISFCAANCTYERYTLLIFADGFFRFTSVVPDTTWFVHVRPLGQANEIELEVAIDGFAVLRINKELAWQGTLSAPLSRMEVIAMNGNASISTLTLDPIEIRKPIP